MKYLVNSREMKQYDTNTTEHFKVPSLLLMERAALAAFEEIKRLCPESHRFLIVCGTGNNGADGLALSRMLYLDGQAVQTVLIGDKKKETAQCKKQLEILSAYGIPVLEAIPENVAYDVIRLPSEASVDKDHEAMLHDIIVDAVFGVGLSRNVEGIFAETIEKMNGLPGKKIALDMPSGISADTGAVLNCAFRADYTITFAYEKVGMHLFPGNEYTGEIVTKQIGITDESFLERKPGVTALEREDLKQLPRRASHSNKGTYGKLLLIAGSVDMAGAAILSARAAYTAGCGLVRIFTPEENRIAIQTSVPEAILTTYHAKKLEVSELLEAMKWADVIVCGPGIGTGETAHQIVKNVLRNASVPVVFDADALNIIAEDTNILLSPHTEMVVTPHLGEMSRLTGDSIAYIQTRLIETAEEFSRQYNVICVLKDEHTVVSIPYGRTYLNLSGNCGMATAGSGDVLTGIIGSLLAQKTDAESAAAFGTYLHGLSGDTALKKCGFRGMIAGDIVNGLKDFLAEWQM